VKVKDQVSNACLKVSGVKLRFSAIYSPGGIIFLGLEIRPSERDALIRRELLTKADRDSKIAVRDALYAYFEKYLDVETPSVPT
jgi:hypothetical protein